MRGTRASAQFLHLGCSSATRHDDEAPALENAPTSSGGRSGSARATIAESKQVTMHCEPGSAQSARPGASRAVGTNGYYLCTGPERGRPRAVRIFERGHGAADKDYRGACPDHSCGDQVGVFRSRGARDRRRRPTFREIGRRPRRAHLMPTAAGAASELIVPRADRGVRAVRAGAAAPRRARRRHGRHRRRGVDRRVGDASSGPTLDGESFFTST